VKQVRDSVGAEHVLLLDAGDTIGDTMLAAETQGKALVQIMNAIGYDAMVIGNHEPDFSLDKLKSRLAEARFGVLGANVIDARTGEPIFQPTWIRQIGGVKVGILGLGYPHTAFTTSPKNVAGARFLPAVETARRWIPRLRGEGVQLLIALSHLGLGADIELARLAKGIDVIVGGHSHNRLSEPMRIGDTIIVQAGAHGSDLGRLDVTVRGGRVQEFRGSLLALDHRFYGAHPDISALVEALRAPHLSQLEEPVAMAEQAVPRAQTLAGPALGSRDAESPVDELFADILRDALQVEVVLLPGVGYGVALGPGPVTAEDLRNLLPHDAEVVTMKMTGQQLRDIIEQSLENVLTPDASRRVGGMIQVSGLAFGYDPNAPASNRLRWVTVQGEQIEPARLYDVATNTLLSEGGHRYRTFQHGEDQRVRGNEYAMIREHLAARRVIAPPHAGRIHVVP
jgi:2',3'-cyclic-nucleotide 2'-phosphodiesterase (5'-nucleotidase family)